MPPVGTECQRDSRPPRKNQPAVPPLPPHPVTAPEDDEDLQRVRDWLVARPLQDLLTKAVVDAINYVLDGASTGRFDLNDPEVDSDERSSVGTKVQYRVLNELGLPKEKPLDTTIAGVAVDIKNTVAQNWMIPREAQCEVCILIQIDADGDRFSARLMRTHRALLNAGNQDSKRSIIKAAVVDYAVPLFDVEWAPLPRNPLRDLTSEQREVVFAPRKGQAVRLTALFGYLPETIIPRHAILTVCANRDDPLRRVRQVKEKVLAEHGLTLLCGTWAEDRDVARNAGYDLGSQDWLAIPAVADRPLVVSDAMPPSLPQPSTPF